MNQIPAAKDSEHPDKSICYCSKHQTSVPARPRRQRTPTRVRWQQWATRVSWFSPGRVWLKDTSFHPSLERGWNRRQSTSRMQRMFNAATSKRARARARLRLQWRWQAALAGWFSQQVHWEVYGAQNQVSFFLSFLLFHKTCRCFNTIMKREQPNIWF